MKPTTLAPAAGDSTADVTGQNLKKAQSKKTKRGENKDLSFFNDSSFNDSWLGHSINVLLIRKNMGRTEKKELSGN